MQCPERKTNSSKKSLKRIKRKKKAIGWAREDWALKRSGIGIYHTMLWTIHPEKSTHERWVRVRITIEEI